MTDVIFEAVALGVDAIISGAVISIIVSVLALNTKLNAHIAQQETFASAATYYRQYSLYNNNEVTATETLSTFLYYDDDIDVIVIDVELEAATGMYARIYEKYAPEGDMTYRQYTITDSPTDAGKCVVASDAGVLFVCEKDYEVVSKKLRECYASGMYQRSVAHNVDFAEITVAVNPYGKFFARLLEDLAEHPVDDNGLYSGSVVTRIWIERIGTIR